MISLAYLFAYDPLMADVILHVEYLTSSPGSPLSQPFDPIYMGM